MSTSTLDSPVVAMTARLTEIRNEVQNLLDQRGALIDLSIGEKRSFSPDEQTRHDSFTSAIDKLKAQIPQVESRLAELKDAEQRQATHDGVRVLEARPAATVTDPEVYAQGNRSASYFRDLANAQCFGDRDAKDRIQRHGRQMEDAEKRALGNTNTTGGSGGEFAPPTWLVNDYIRLARAGRVTADLFNHMPVPFGTSNINLPKIATGTTVALQSTQNTNLSNTDITTTYVGTGFSTLGGGQVVAQQLLDQSGTNFDQVITGDLAAAFAQQVGAQVFLGAGAGANNNSVVNGLMAATVPAGNQITFTSASPTAQLFWSKAAGALAAFATTRFAEADTWVMHPRRWYWLLAQTDSQGRPLVVPNGAAFNPMATDSGSTPVAGPAGTFMSLPVYLDPNVPTNLGTGTNQDRVFLLRRSDLWLFESPSRAEVFTQPFAQSLGVYFRLYGYVGTILNRFPASIGYIDGTGLVAPTF